MANFYVCYCSACSTGYWGQKQQRQSKVKLAGINQTNAAKVGSSSKSAKCTGEKCTVSERFHRLQRGTVTTRRTTLESKRQDPLRRRESASRRMDGSVGEWAY